VLRCALVSLGLLIGILGMGLNKREKKEKEEEEEEEEEEGAIPFLRSRDDLLLRARRDC